MRTKHIKILILTVMTVVLLSALPCKAVNKDDKFHWSEDKSMRRHGQRMLTDEKIERIMNRLKDKQKPT